MINLEGDLIPGTVSCACLPLHVLNRCPDCSVHPAAFPSMWHTVVFLTWLLGKEDCVPQGPSLKTSSTRLQTDVYMLCSRGHYDLVPIKCATVLGRQKSLRKPCMAFMFTTIYGLLENHNVEIILASNKPESFSTPLALWSGAVSQGLLLLCRDTMTMATLSKKTFHWGDRW